MSLLPRTAEEFSSAEYWEKFFKKRGEKAFEWYGDYNKLCGVLHKYIKVQDKVNWVTKRFGETLTVSFNNALRNLVCQMISRATVICRDAVTTES